MNKSVNLVIVFLSLFVLSAFYVLAVPTEPTGPMRLTYEGSSRYDTSNWPPMTQEAEAGNLSELSIYSLTQTQTWQGYYGDISGTITLDDASNHTMYDWYAAEPQGVIYAASQLISNWGTVHCLEYNATHNYCMNTSNSDYNGSFFTTNFTLCNETMQPNAFNHTYFYWYDNYTKNSTADIYLNRTKLEEGNLPWSLGLTTDEYDGVDETFNSTGTIQVSRTTSGNTYENHTGFFVGTTAILEGSCPATDTYETKCVNKTDPDEQNQYAVYITADNNSGENNYFGQSLCDIYASDPTQLLNGSIFNNTYQASNYSGIYKLDGTKDGNNFQEVLLTVNDTETIIYTTIIENRRENNQTDITGFDNQTHDFQMLVGDDGHPGANQDTTTTYYFYVELV